MDFKVRLKTRAHKFYKSQPLKTQRVLIRQLEELAQNPTKNSTMLDEKLQIYRVKCKKFRILYQIQKHKVLILVITIGNLKDTKLFYDKLVKSLKSKLSHPN